MKNTLPVKWNPQLNGKAESVVFAQGRQRVSCLLDPSAIYSNCSMLVYLFFPL